MTIHSLSQNLSPTKSVAHSPDRRLSPQLKKQIDKSQQCRSGLSIHRHLLNRPLAGRALTIDSDAYFRLAQEKLKKGNIHGYEYCLTIAVAATKCAKSKLTFLTDLYHSQFDRDSFKKGLSTCLEALSLNPNKPEWVFNQALCCLHLKQLDKAFQLFTNILKLKPEVFFQLIPSIEEAVGNLIEILRNPALSRTETKVVVDLHDVLYRFQILLKNYAGALSTCNHLTPLLPEDDVHLLVSKAYCYLKLNDYDSALRLYNAILDLRLDLGHNRKDCLQAIEDLQQAQNKAVNPETKLEFLNCVFEFHVRLQQHYEAYETCLEIEKIEPNSTALEQIQALYKAERISWDEMQSSFNQAYMSRSSLHVQAQTVTSLAILFDEMNLGELAGNYRNWVLELTR